MSKRVNKPIIGKDIARTESLVTEGASQNIAVGEVFVADKYKNPLATAATIATSDIIYVGVGLAETHDYVLPDGTAITGNNRIAWSAPIEGTGVITYNGISGGTTATERVASCDTSGITPVVGTEYVVRVVYKDLEEHPGQFVQEFRHVATTAVIADLVNALVTEVNKYGPSNDIDARVIATNSTSDLVLTGRVIPENASNDEIDEYSQVDFEVALNSTTSAGINTNGWAGTGVAIAITYTAATPGIGNPKLVRDKEKHATAYDGVTNTINFPVIKPTILTDMAEWYDVIVIEHDNSYESGETQYIQSTPITTEIYIPTGAAQTSTDPTLGVDAVTVALNAWMVSTPKAFSAVSV